MKKSELQQIIREEVNKILNESKSTNIIIVDIQPAYDKFCGHLMPSLCEFLNNQTGKILILFNGEDLNLDSKNDIINYYLNYGLDENKINNIEWKEKMYGYFRDLMDSGVEDYIIIKIIREMILTRVNDSRELSQEFLDKMIKEYDVNLDRMPVFLPDISISLLREYNHCYMGGGGKHECFREITLFMNALNIKYKEMKNFIY
jgi:hypothetical protein